MMRTVKRGVTERRRGPRLYDGWKRGWPSEPRGREEGPLGNESLPASAGSGGPAGLELGDLPVLHRTLGATQKPQGG